MNQTEPYYVGTAQARDGRVYEASGTLTQLTRWADSFLQRHGGSLTIRAQGKDVDAHGGQTAVPGL